MKMPFGRRRPSETQGGGNDEERSRAAILQHRRRTALAGGRHALARRVRRLLWTFLCLNVATTATLLATTTMRLANAKSEYRIELSTGGTLPLAPLDESAARALAGARQAAD